MSERAVLLMTDVHYGKVTPSFSPESVEEMYPRLSKRLATLKKGLAKKTEGLTVFLLGDVNDGTGIYATQSHHQAMTNVEQQASEMSHILAKFLYEQKKVWGDVEVQCVAGNHGRAGKFAHEAANWDLVTYRYLQLLMRGDTDPIRVMLPDAHESPFIRKVDVNGHGFLLYHGHDIRSWGGIPWYGILLRLLRWYSAIPDWEVAVMGHFHTFGYWKFNALSAFLSGTMVTDDEWALRVFGWQSAPTWWLFGVDENSPVTWQYPIDLKG